MPGSLKAVIVDDDKFNSLYLKQLVNNNVPSVEIVAEINDPLIALQQLPLIKPHIVFLDIEMPKMNAFELLTKLGNINFGIIFTTMYDHYAIRAIRFAAIDYLLKPIDATALQEAVSRAKDRINYYSTLQPANILPPILANKNSLDIFAVPSVDGVVFLKIADIIYCESADRYVKIYMADKKNIMVTRTLRELEELLTGSNFIRIHKSFLINLLHLKKYIRGENQVLLSDETLLDVSRNKKEEMLSRVSHL